MVKRYRLYVQAPGSMLPVEYSCVEDEVDILDMVDAAISDGYFQFTVVLA